MGAIQRVKEAIESIKRGEIIVMIDDEDRENEGDLVYASTFSTPEKVNFLATHGKGLICVALPDSDAKRLNLFPMVDKNTSSYETAFTVSVDAKDALTGISAGERDMTIQILANPLAKADELVRPGHIFPLIAKDGGTLVRTGHTEGSVDICRLSGLQESAVICEIMREDGEMARRDDLLKFSKEHELKIVYISDIVEYRLQNETLVEKVSENEEELFDTKVSKFVFKDHQDREHTAIRFYSSHATTNLRVHHIGKDVELLTNSKKHKLLEKSIDYLKQNGGILLFLSSSEKSKETIKEFGVGAQILKSMGVEKIHLLSEKRGRDLEFVGIHGFGLEIIDEVVLSTK
jgi:3,4-dihydroxy 2-butanone 4-phosphate synthase/GTP cyclohydrolase II